MVLTEFATVTENALSRTDVKGFPIISADDRRILMGFIDRSELLYILGTTSLVGLLRSPLTYMLL